MLGNLWCISYVNELIKSAQKRIDHLRGFLKKRKRSNEFLKCFLTRRIAMK